MAAFWEYGVLDRGLRMEREEAYVSKDQQKGNEHSFA